MDQRRSAVDSHERQGRPDFAARWNELSSARTAAFGSDDAGCSQTSSIAGRSRRYRGWAQADRLADLSDYPACDNTVKNLGRHRLGRLQWPKCEKSTVWQRPHLLGRAASRHLPSGPCENRILKRATATSSHNIHRSIEGADAYFVANRSGSTAAMDCTFRVDGQTTGNLGSGHR